MKKVPFVALALLSWCATSAGAAEIKNLRPVYGIFGAEREGNKILPGDVLAFAFDLVGLEVEPNSGLVQYTIKLQVLDSKGTRIFGRESKSLHYLTLGKATVSERAQVITGADLKPGKYSVKLTATDRRVKDPKPAEVSYDFEILPAAFGLIHVNAPAVAVPLQDYVAHCALVGWTKDEKKRPNVTLTLKILDESGKPTLAKPVVTNLPKDVPGVDFTDKDVIPLPFPITLNRAGRFTIEIQAVDNLNKKAEPARVRFPLVVVEPSVFAAEKK